MSDAVILRAREAALSRSAGGKARALARAQLAGLPVPPWFVVSSAACPASLARDQPGDRLAGEAAHEGVPGTQALPHGLRVELDEAVRTMAADGALLAVRSSASDEDGDVHSFAGQLESFLNVRPADVAARVVDVWRSGFSERVIAYRRERNLPGPPAPPAVLVQRMVVPRAAGVAFGADPVSGRRGRAVVSAVPGLGSALVSGEADADTWMVDRQGAIVERHVATKRRMHVADPDAPGGIRTADVSEAAARRPSLSDEEILSVAELARAAGRHFGRPQDIEWALDERLYLLQSRPITSLTARPDPDARLVLWDNSNIVESYSGVTTPLTFSFAAEIYEHVYRQFCRMMGVPERTIEAADDTFANMLGLVRGRLFYNLLSWYRVLAMLPGYRLNRRFMEQMMGVKEPLPDALAADVAATVRHGPALDAIHTARTLIRLLGMHLSLDRRVDAFTRRLDEALRPPQPSLEDRRIDELVAHYRNLRGQLLLRWDAPIVNDFFAMVFYGSLRALVTRWCGDGEGTLQNDLIGGEGGMVSAEPAVRMQRMAKDAAGHPEIVTVLRQGTVDDVRAVLDRHDRLKGECDAYLSKFGDRTINELKLESLTLHDDPLPLFRAIGALASQQDTSGAPPGAESPADRLRAASRARVHEALAGHPLRRILFGWVLGHARRRVRDRENLRLERTRLFGRVRRIFLGIGKRLEAVGVLDDERDVFHLEVDEVLAFVEGHATTVDLRALAALRKAEWKAYSDGPAPADRFETRGAVYQGHDFRAPETSASDATGDVGKGLGCSPGIVRGPVRVVRDPNATTLDPGAILVAEHTDPGWIMIFPSARGVLVERGSLLSHAAIVARELGIPAIVSLAGLTRWLRDGDWVEMDGATGLVRRVAPPAGIDA